MGWKINDAVVRGEIDNRVEGRTSGRIWLLGRDAPLVLDLEGDCWRDLAGTCFSFRNPDPRPQPEVTLSPRQTGVVGDITASRKIKVPLIHMKGVEGPFAWNFALYLEWFSEADGRVLIETCDFETEITDRTWEMDGDAEGAQKLANLQAMRDSVSRDVKRVEPSGGEPDDEYPWDERLKESERMAAALQEVREKYRDDPEAARKEAFAMGWDGLLDVLARKDSGPEEPPADPSLDWRDHDEEDDRAEESADEPGHPLQIEARDVVLRGIDLTQSIEELPAAIRLNQTLTQVEARLAGILNSSYRAEAGYVLAKLNRVLDFLNEALAAGSELIETAEDIDQARALEALKESILALREGVVNLGKEFKGN